MPDIYPISDISSGSWTDEGTADNDGNLYTSVDETSTPSDGDTSYINCPNGGGTCEVKLDTASDPGVGTGHIVHVYGKGTGTGGPEKIDVYLYESTTLIATLGSNWGPGRGSYTDLNYTLTTTEANNITDYSDLRVRMVEDTVGSGEGFRVTRIYMEIPAADVTVTPAAVSAIAGKVDPTVVLGSVTVTPAVGTTIASKVDPTVIYGSLTITPSPASAIGNKVDPTVDIGDTGVTVEPAAVNTIASSIAPAVVLGSISITPAPASSISSSVDPTVVYGSLSITPPPSGAIASTTRAAQRRLQVSYVKFATPKTTVGIEIEPSPVSSIASSVNPTVVHGSNSVTSYGNFRQGRSYSRARKHRHISDANHYYCIIGRSHGGTWVSRPISGSININCVVCRPNSGAWINHCLWGCIHYCIFG
jgi:hypothetical protein